MKIMNLNVVPVLSLPQASEWLDTEPECSFTWGDACWTLVLPDDVLSDLTYAGPDGEFPELESALLSLVGEGYYVGFHG